MEQEVMQDRNTIFVSVLTPHIGEETEYMRKNRELLSNDVRVKEFLTGSDTPIGKARNNLLRRAGFEFLLWLDSDIELLNNPIDILVNSLTSTPNIAGICLTDVVTQDQEQYVTEEVIRRSKPEVYSKKNRIFSASMFKKSILERAGGFDPTMIAGEDNDLHMHLIQMGLKVLALKNHLVLHHMKMTPERRRKYWEGYKLLFKKYGRFEYETPSCGRIGIYYYMANISPSFFLKHALKRINVHINRVYWIIRNLLKSIIIEANPEKVTPKSCGLLITENCFFRCMSCTYWKKSGNEATTRDIFKIIDRLRDFGIKDITLTGGEPLIRSDLLEIVRYIKSKGMSVGIITNGWVHKRQVFQELDFVVVSIDGMEKTHDRLRGMKGSWERAVDLVFELSQEMKKPTSMNFVVQCTNYKEIPFVCDFFSFLGVPINFLCYNIGGMGQPSSRNPRKMETDNFREITSEICKRYEYAKRQQLYLRDALKKINTRLEQRCIAPNLKIMVRPNGEVFPCSAWNHSVGNLFEKSMHEIWSDYKSLRSKIRKGYSEHCRDCFSCELGLNYSCGHGYLLYLKNSLVNALCSLTRSRSEARLA